jgi:hypothetical protein
MSIGYTPAMQRNIAAHLVCALVILAQTANAQQQQERWNNVFASADAG